MVRHTNPDEANFAPKYRENRESITRDDVTYSRFGGLTVSSDARAVSTRKTALEFEYATSHGNTKTVRALQATSATDNDRDRGLPDDRESYTFYDGEQGFAVTDNMNLYRYGDDHTYRRVAEDVDVFMVELPDPAPVTGAVQDGVSVTVHYRSNRSGNLKSIRLDDVSADWEGDRVRGYHARRDRTVEVEAVYERSVTSKSHRGGDREIGKCARIDFPAGQSFRVDAYGVADDERAGVADLIEQEVDSVLSSDDVDVTVEELGRIDD